MTEPGLPNAPTGDNGKGFDLVMAFCPSEWPTATQEEKAILALAPLASFARVLDGENSAYTM